MGLCISHDAGATWTIESAGLHASHCSAVAFWGDQILVSAATDPFAAQGTVYRRPASPKGDIVHVGNGLPEWLNRGVDTAGIATDGSVIVIAERCGTLYRATEFGGAWTQIASGLPSPSSVLIV